MRRFKNKFGHPEPKVKDPKNSVGILRFTQNDCRFRFFVLFFYLFSIIALPLQAAGGYFIQEVRVVGTRSVPETTILARMKTKQGLISSREAIHRDVQEIFKMGYFQDIDVQEERGAHGYIYTFVVTEKPIISKIVFEGNKKIKDAALRDAVTIGLYQPLQEQKIAQSMEVIRKLYSDKKFYLVDLDYKLRTNSDGDQEFVFMINEHAQALVRHVHFIGNSVFTDKELRDVVKTKKKGPFGFISGSGKYKEDQLKEDAMRLTFHYLKNGYLKVRVGKPEVSLTKDKRYFFITFNIVEGERYRIGQIDISGDTLTTKQQLTHDLLTRGGQIYNRELIEKDMRALTRLYADQGYAFANIQPLTTTDEVAKTANINFHVEKGKRITIERIEISGNTVSRDKVIRREMRVKEGDLYNETKLDESKQRIMALGYFKDVNFATPRGRQDDTLILNVTVEERPTGNFSIGAGFSTAEDFIFQASVQKQNFFGRGWSGEISAELSSIRQQFQMSMTDPYFFDTEWIFSVNASRVILRYGDISGGTFDRESYGGGASIGHRFFDHAAISLGYQAEQVAATSLPVNTPARFLTNADGVTSQLSLTLSRDTRDNRVYANKGMYNALIFSVSGTKLGGDNDFFKMEGRTQIYVPIVKKLIFKTYGRAGYIGSLNDSVVPLFERYYVGGPNSLRGFIPFKIGPQENSFVYGGNQMAVFNLELEHPIYDPAGLKFVTFFDAGNSFGEDQKLDFHDFRMDFGFGIRWVSPMGPLRFEWGFPIDKQPGEDGTVFNFSIGTFF